MKKIAVLRRNGFGDLICTYPLIAHLKARYPDAEITLFVDQRNAVLAPYLFPNERICVFPRGNKYLSVLRTALKQPHFDLALSAKPTPMKLNNIFLAALRAKRTIAVAKGDKWHERWISDKRAVPYGHQALRCLNIFDPHITTIDHRPTLSTSKIDLSLPGPVLYVSLTNNRATSQISPSRIASLANRLGCSVAINAQADNPAVHELTRLLTVPHRTFITPHFHDFLQLVASVDLLLLGDGGTCHIAACFNKPQVTVFAHTPVDQWRPLSDKATVFFHDHDVNAVDEALLEGALRHHLTHLAR